jgi:hypothetical protein
MSDQILIFLSKIKQLELDNLISNFSALSNLRPIRTEYAKCAPKNNLSFISVFLCKFNPLPNT